MNQGYYKKEVTLEFCDCDNQKRAKLATIMKYMADVAGLAYGDKGYSHTWLWEHDYVFLLSRVSIHIDRMPKAEEKITIHTWEHDVKGPLFFRNFEIYDQENKKIIVGVTGWVLVNPSTRKIIKPSSFTGKSDLMPDKNVNTLPLCKLKIEDELQELGTRKIVYSDIDANNHVYNAVYGAIACDFLPQECIDKPLVDFRINFKQEALLGETMQIKAHTGAENAFVVGTVHDVVSFECEFIFQK